MSLPAKSVAYLLNLVNNALTALTTTVSGLLDTISAAQVNKAILPLAVQMAANGINATANGLYLNRGSGGAIFFGNSAGGYSAYVDQNGYGVFTNASATSDIRLKTNIKPIDQEGILEKIGEIEVISFSYKTDQHTVHLGISAQSLWKNFPAATPRNADGYLTVSPTSEAALAFLAVQVLTKKVDQLQAEVAALKDSKK